MFYDIRLWLCFDSVVYRRYLASVIRLHHVKYSMPVIQQQTRLPRCCMSKPQQRQQGIYVAIHELTFPRARQTPTAYK